MKLILNRYFFPIILSIIIFSCSVKEEKRVVLLQTTDVHGVILPYDFIEKKELNASLANVAEYLKKVRQESANVVLLDGGDNLQGQPTVYFYNFIDTVSTHINAEVMNYMQYDAAAVGNHDIEAGHPVYDRLITEYEFPLLAANAVDKLTGEPYFKPYTVVERNGIKIAVLGMITPEVPTWLPPELYNGIEFRDMVETARTWMPVLEKENPDIIAGLFHSGWSEGEASDGGSHDDRRGSAAVAYEVPGFDIVFCGHDHNIVNKKIVNQSGDTVLILDGGSRSDEIARADLIIEGKGRIKSMQGEIIKVSDYSPEPGFVGKFAQQRETISNYVDKIIATSEADISSREAYFGPSAFVSMIHEIQMELTGADLSFAAPLSFDVKISSGPVTVSDMFKLYRFENMLYTMELSGEEIRKYLEFSYSGWMTTMKGPGDYLLRFRTGSNGKPVLTNRRAWLSNQPYNFDSAAGIEYVVDVSKPEGKRIAIKSFSDGRDFDPNKRYKVAVNSYRGNGGGGHFTEGAGIASSELEKRLIKSTDRDLRYYIMTTLETKKIVKPVTFTNWKIIPAEWVARARKREYELLFGN